MLRGRDFSLKAPDQVQAAATKIFREGDASNAAVAFVVAKNFFGSSFMLVPKGFQESGIVSGPVCLLVMNLMEVQTMFSLIKCRQAFVPGTTYEELGAAIHPSFPRMITFMVMLSQFGFCSIWLVSTAENLSMVLPELSHSQRLWIQFPVLFMLNWVRKIEHFSFTNAVGTAGTVAMILYFLYFMTDRIATVGVQPVQSINTANTDLLLWLGTCAYAYAGANMV